MILSLMAATPLVGGAPLLVAFTDSSLGMVSAWSWDFGDGTTGTGRAVEHRYTAAGTFTVRLTVTDDDGITASVADVVTVEP